MQPCEIFSLTFFLQFLQFAISKATPHWHPNVLKESEGYSQAWQTEPVCKPAVAEQVYKCDIICNKRVLKKSISLTVLAS